MKSAVIVESMHAQFLRKYLQCKGYWDESRKLKRIENGKVAIPVILENETEVENLELFITETWNSKQLTDIPEFKIDNVLLPPSKKSQIQTPYDKLLKVLANLLTVNHIEFTDEFEKDVPSHWEVHGDLLLLPEECFQFQIWKQLEPSLWRDIAAVFNCSKVAQKSVVSRDGFRTPQVKLLLGDDGWVHQIDNGLRFTYDVTKCMYSSGNITEKLRIAKFNCDEEIVVDLYAGIGYFTLPYLVHAKAKHVHACEWNPDAVEGLQKNLHLNNVSDRCTVHFGDNRKVCPIGIADRVNLGLIPSSEPGWSIACAALNPRHGGILHIHHNVNSSQKCFNTGKNKVRQNEIFSNVPVCYTSCEGGSNLNLSESDGNRNDLNYKEVCTCLNGELGVSVDESDESVSIPEIGQGDASVQESGQGTFAKEVGQGETQNDMCQSLQNIIIKDKLDEKMDGKMMSSNPNKNYTCMKCGKMRQETLKSMLLQPKREIWTQWAFTISDAISDSLHKLHKNKWITNILHIEHVKSYAPHIDHLVLDLECRPI